VDTGELLPVAVEQEHVAFIPGHAFVGPGVAERNQMRLNFSHCCLSDIEEGIGRLGRVLENI
jgi:DNA-binding transcriptional MocR family regulator